jgi:HD-GYP domain-containing protein (c-di-GMP phosphodiesterase class II)
MLAVSPAPVNEASPPETSPVGVDDLIVGRATSYPIYDRRGLLLLAAGKTITAEMKRNLRSRSGDVVLMHDVDIRRTTLTDCRVSAPPALLDCEMSRELDAIIDRGFSPFANQGPAIRESVAPKGRTPYEPQYRQRLIQQHEENVGHVAEMMRSALDGEAVDGGRVTELTAGFLRELTVDGDNVLTSIAAAFQRENLAVNCVEVALLSMAIGIEMEMDAANVRELGLCALVHDWGMLRVPEEIRNAPRRLTPAEHAEITKHPMYSLEMLEKMSAVPGVAPVVVYQIHERPNGQGYPRGRKGRYIHPFAKVIQVADSFIALRAERPYRGPLMAYSAMACLVHQARDRYLEPDVVRALLRVQSLFPLGSLVALSDASVARVLRANGEQYTKPIVERIQHADGEPADPSLDENLIDLTQSPLTIRQALPTPGRRELTLAEEAASAAENS